MTTPMKTLKQYKVKKTALKDCPGCSQSNRLEGKVDALLILHKADPAQVIRKNPGGVDEEYLALRLKGKHAYDIIKAVLFLLAGLGLTTGVLKGLGVF